MSKSFQSKALKVNLSQTRQKDITFHEDHLWLLDLSKNHWGIHERTRNFFEEYHHTYVNQKLVGEELRRLALGDFWFYAQCEDSKKALSIILQLFEDSLEKAINDESFEIVYVALIEYLALNSQQSAPDRSLLSDGLALIRKWTEQNNHSVLRNSSFLRNQLFLLSNIPNLKKDFFSLLYTIAEKVIEFWSDTSQIEEWYNKNHKFFSKDFEPKIFYIGEPFFQDLKKKLTEVKNFNDLDKNIPLYFEIAEYFIGFTDSFSIINDRFYYILYLLHIPGMSHVKNNLMVELNGLIKKIFENIEAKQVNPFLSNIFLLFNELQKEQSSLVLDCISTLGKEIIHSKAEENLHDFINKLVELPFVVPGALNISSDWRTKVDINHIKNIRVWLELFELAPQQYSRLITSLTVVLKLKGIFIFDTDLFQKDVSKLLNSDFHSHFRIVKQLCKVFPVYFNEIGAEGELRDITTAIDELTSRKDKLIHYLRKLVHIESNNTHIILTKNIFRFWLDRNLKPLEPLLPEDVKYTIDPDGKWVVPMQNLISKVAEKARVKPADLIENHPDKIDKWVDAVPGHLQLNKKRLKKLCRLYFILTEKYSFSSVNIAKSIRKYNFIAEKELCLLENALKKKNHETALKYIFSFISVLNKVILSEEKTEGWENIYHKRHVAFGIPSMYGEYHERRFEAMGLIFKLEHAASLIAEELVRSVNLNYITAKTLEKIASVLELYKEGLLLDGIENHAFNSNMGMFSHSLKSQSFSLHQFINLFEFMGENIREIITKYFFRPYEDILKILVPQIQDEQKHGARDKNSFLHKQSEAFYRDMLSTSFLLQSLDNFIAEVLTSLRNMVDSFNSEKIHDIMTYNPDMIISSLYDHSKNIDNQVFIGSKAFFLKKLYMLGYPVPPGFVITTEVFRRKDTILQHKLLSRDIDNMIQAQIRKLEKITCNELGNPACPLMLSVRSGTVVSMPGAMNTFLNVGINETIIEALSKRPNYGWTSWDCYRRFLQSWGMASGISRDTFDHIMINFKEKHAVDQKVQFTPKQMRDIAFAYKEVLRQNNIHIEEEMFPQIRQAILNVFDSWNTGRTKVYREHLHIADEWGTAVIVQKMVLGNINYTSGTGVVFTQNPHNRKAGINLYGDYSLVSQGEDVVGGLVHVLPVSSNQSGIGSGNTALEVKFPLIYKRLYDIASELIEKHGFNHQEIEFTFESERPEDFHILQTRDQDMRPKDKTQKFAISSEKMKLLGQGIGIGGGAINGILLFDYKDLESSRQKFPDKKLILVRPDTVPDDIDLIFRCDGLLTSRGGATSHAAVTAARLGKICIVNCTDLVVNEKEKKCSIKKQELFAGDEIAIDGNLGNIYKGHYAMMKND